MLTGSEQAQSGFQLDTGHEDRIDLRWWWLCVIGLYCL